MKRYLLLFMIVLFAVRGFSQGLYAEFRTTVGGSAAAFSNMKVFARDGNSRAEISFSTDGSQPMSHNIVMLVLKENQNIAYWLDENRKTYTEMDSSLNVDWRDYDVNDYEVTVVGKEKVNGYNTIHVRVKNKKTSDFDEEYWTTTEIAYYPEFEKLRTKYTARKNLNKALAINGAEGFPVRTVVHQLGKTIQNDLVKVEQRNNPVSLFSLQGYTESIAGPGAKVKQLMQQMQNMTPEQREEYIQQLKQQMGSPH